MRFCENEIVKLDYVNDELDKKTQRVFELHLSTCVACRQDVDSLLYMASAVRGIPRPAPTWELVEQTRMRLEQTTTQRSLNQPLRASLDVQSDDLIPNVLTPILIAVALIALFWVFHDYVALGLQKTIELSVAELLWGTDTGRAGASLSIPIAAMLLILALLAIPSLFENARSLRARSFPHATVRDT